VTITQIQENKNILIRFARLHQNGRLAHAYLLIGPASIGKSETALAIAKLVNCQDNGTLAQDTYCGVCPSCLKIDGGNHPDVLLIDSGGESSIKIAQIRDLISRSQLRPYEAKKKVFIIKNIEELTLQGSNALLKTLEEPPADSLLLLTTSVLEKNLGTIRSRCHAVYFFAQPYGELKTSLQKTLGLNESRAHFLAHFAEGFPGRAQLFQDEDVFTVQNQILDQLVIKKKYVTFLKSRTSDKDQIKLILNVLLSWYRDLCLLKNGVPEEHVVHRDRVDELKKHLSKYSFDQIQDILAAIVRTNKLLEENLNIKISLNILMEKIWLRS